MKISVENKVRFVIAATTEFGDRAVVAAPRITKFAEKIGEPKPMWLFVEANRVSRGMYRIPAAPAGIPSVIPKINQKQSEQVASPQMSAQVIALNPTKKFDPNAVSEHSYAAIPERDSHYVPFGEFKDIEKIVKSGVFFPVFISGLSGNGKTFMVEQAASRAQRPMMRVQMSRETDEDDLIGGFRLIDGETKFLKGPVLRAMEIGALLLIDEADRADPGKVMCLQGILEGKSYYVKKTGEIVTPKPGFNIIVTANSKGKGSDDGRYIAASILDDAWLERFPITIEQDYPPNSIEQKIVRGYLCDDRECNEEDTNFVLYLTNWAEIIRKTFNEGAIDEMISTRRLVHIVQTYKMFGDRMRAIRLCINRFDEETKTAFLDLYAKVDPSLAPPTPVVDPTVVPTVDPSAIANQSVPV
jgi:hypothetical protein